MPFDNGEWPGLVKYVTELPPDDEGRETFGEYSPPDGTGKAEVNVVGLGPRFKVLQRMLHELIHDCEEAEELDLPDDTVDALARYLARVIRNSPRLLDFARECSKESTRRS